MRYIIEAVTVTGPHTVEIAYAHGEIRVVDFQPIIEKGGVFAPMTDPDIFALVEVSDDGRYITWPGELDFCADAIRTDHRTAART